LLEEFGELPLFPRTVRLWAGPRFVAVLPYPHIFLTRCLFAAALFCLLPTALLLSLYPLAFQYQNDCLFGYFGRGLVAWAVVNLLGVVSSRVMLYGFAPTYKIKAAKNVSHLVKMRMDTRTMSPGKFWIGVTVLMLGLYNIHYVRSGCSELCCGLSTNIDSFYFVNSVYALALSIPCVFMVLFVYHNDPLEDASYQQLRSYMHEQRSIHGGG
jgi:hypothetical protein